MRPPARLFGTALLFRLTLASQLTVGDVIGTGAFGSVHEGRLHGRPCVAKRASSGKRAAFYLSQEAFANQMLVDRGTEETPPCIAHYMGEHTVGGVRFLVWDCCGGSQRPRTLDDFLQSEGGLSEPGQGGLSELADLLGCSRRELPGLVLKYTLSALAHIHALGVVHRDVKPENLLVDPVHRTLVLIDFGSSCDAAGWVVKRGYEAGRVPCSVLYCPPEQLLSIDAPYTYDVYSAALIWLRIALPTLAASEEALYRMRMELKGHHHDLRAWHAHAAAAGTLPPGWSRAFASAGPHEDARHHAGEEHRELSDAEPLQRQLAWDLLSSLLAVEPAERPSAAEALIGPFLNAECELDGESAPAPRPWTLEALVASTLSAPPARLVAEQCVLPDAPAEETHAHRMR